MATGPATSLGNDIEYIKEVDSPLPFKINYQQ